MTASATLGQLSHLQNLLCQVVESVDPASCRIQYHPHLRPLGWYLGECAYFETQWLRARVMGEDQSVAPLAPLYGPDALAPEAVGEQLPSRDDLLYWARAWMDDNIMRLANPRLLPDHALLRDDRLALFIIQHHALRYEEMLMVMNQRAGRQAGVDFDLRTPLRPRPPEPETREVPRGHYRVGTAQTIGTLDIERPPQAVELSAFRIGRRPASNGEYLGFMEAGGYGNQALWSEAGWNWLCGSGVRHPDCWRQNPQGDWFGIGIKGPFELDGNAPVQGLSRHEAEAFAQWAGSQATGLAGACLPHEYQWEVASRLGSLDEPWQVREWCSNELMPYAGFRPEPEGNDSERLFDHGHGVLRGGTIHTQAPIQRTSFRYGARPDRRFGFSGVRLVLPPE